SHYKGLVALYTFLGGLAGAAQVIATLADRFRRRPRDPLVRNGRMIAAAGGGMAGPALLIADLYTPRRWFNMLRIWRSTSPMSIGSYILTAYGGSSFIVAAARGRFPRAARAVQLPAAVAGAGMTTYTAPLLSSTATPLWAA